MRLYVFRSDASGALRAFAGYITASKLPKRFRPWHAVGAVAPDAAPPMGFRARAPKKPSMPRDFSCGA